MKRLIIKLTITLLVFALCFSAPLFVKAANQPVLATYTEQTSSELMALFQIDTYTAAEPYIQIEEGQVTILFNTDEKEQLVYAIDHGRSVSVASETTHQITANLASGSHTIHISLTDANGQTETFSYQVEMPESSQQEKVSQVHFTDLTAIREQKKTLI
ncbi:hypothetical protein [Listeria costaricensis]|uniref:hypothetical protein n=1 Tax=Listeria costaricensis TaxID=2026604 RepID=UPI000C08C4EB|nr:hypothetical protein [Listeria costaricensis]